MLERFTEVREVRVYAPDVTLESSLEVELYVLKIPLPKQYDIVGVQQTFTVSSERKLNTTVAYAFLIDPTAPVAFHMYVTTAFPNRPFPWPKASEYPVVTCGRLGLTQQQTPMGPVFMTHLYTLTNNEEEFERELHENQYRIILVKQFVEDARVLQAYRELMAGLQAQVQAQVQAAQTLKPQV